MSEEEKQIHLYMHSKNELGLATLCVEKDKEIERLKEENTILKQTMSNNSLLINENAFLKERIDKAIEYIDRRDIEWGSEEHKNLLDILKGVDKE